MKSIAETSNGRRVLVLIPGSVNYFYNLSGRRVAEAAGELGFSVDVTTLDRCPERAYDWCVLSNVPEILHGYGDEAAGIEKLRAIRGRCRVTSALAIDCVATPWYHRLSDLSSLVGASTILDLGLHDQGPALRPQDRASYRFVFSGLTPSERHAMASDGFDDHDRVIPWAFVGHVTPYRAAMVDHLVQEVDPRGFAYLPNAAPYTETGSPHLNQSQFETVLRKTRYQVWCSHHHHFYMEPERFRTSLLTGGVPIKVKMTDHAAASQGPIPFIEWLVEPTDVAPRMRDGDFEATRRKFRQEWLRMPSLSREVARFLADQGLDARPPHPVARAG